MRPALRLAFGLLLGVACGVDAAQHRSLDSPPTPAPVPMLAASAPASAASSGAARAPGGAAPVASVPSATPAR